MESHMMQRKPTTRTFSYKTDAMVLLFLLPLQ